MVSPRHWRLPSGSLLDAVGGALPVPIDAINFRPSAERGNLPPPAFGLGSPRLASWPGYATGV